MKPRESVAKRNVNFESIIKEIEALLIQKRSVIVAISGFGGSGKTTLADRLHTHFTDSTKLQLDNFLVNHGEGDGWQGGYDWKRFELVLIDIKSGKHLKYQWYNWEKDETKEWIEQPLPSIIIVEGVRLFNPMIIDYFDLKIWVNVSLEMATQQGKARDYANKTNLDFDIESHIARWDEVWIPKEREFVSLFDPSEQADALYSQSLD